MKNRWMTKSKFASMTQLMLFCLEKLILNRIITYSIIALLCLSTFYRCQSRTPSDVRLEKAAEIKLPKEYVVIKDEYQDMIQDYCIIYEIKVGNQSATELIKNIKASPLYHPDIKPHEKPTDSLSNQNGNNGVWCRSGQNYHFSRHAERTSYSIEFNTLTKVLKYIETYD